MSGSVCHTPTRNKKKSEVVPGNKNNLKEMNFSNNTELSLLENCIKKLGRMQNHCLKDKSSSLHWSNHPSSGTLVNVNARKVNKECLSSSSAHSQDKQDVLPVGFRDSTLVDCWNGKGIQDLRPKQSQRNSRVSSPRNLETCSLSSKSC